MAHAITTPLAAPLARRAQTKKFCSACGGLPKHNAGLVSGPAGQAYANPTKFFPRKGKKRMAKLEVVNANKTLGDPVQCRPD